MKSIFIVGYWNSGTTLLVDILRKHPAIKLKKARYKPNLEERTLRKILNSLGTDFFHFGDYSDVIEHGFKNFEEPTFNQQQHRTFRRKFLWHFGVPKHKILLLKNPYLFFFNRFIKENFKEDKVKKIVILRDGRSQVVSKDYWLKHQENPEQHLFARAKFWVRAMEHYFETWYHDKDTLTIRYENLCTHPEATIRQICHFLEVDFKAFKHSIPTQLENRMTRWEQLDDDLKTKVIPLLSAMQAKIDNAFPLK